MIGRLARTVVPDILYLEYKALYLELKPSVAAFVSVLPVAAVAGRPPYQTTATSAAAGAMAWARKRFS